MYGARHNFGEVISAADMVIPWKRARYCLLYMLDKWSSGKKILAGEDVSKFADFCIMPWLSASC